jgi:hypothetical protein
MKHTIASIRKHNDESGHYFFEAAKMKYTTIESAPYQTPNGALFVYSAPNFNNNRFFAIGEYNAKSGGVSTIRTRAGNMRSFHNKATAQQFARDEAKAQRNAAKV